MQQLLLIEDDASGVDLVAEYLTQNGFEVEHAQDGQSGLSNLQTPQCCIRIYL